MSEIQQLTVEDVRRLHAAKRYDQIEQARAEGRLDVMLGGQAPPDTETQLTAADVSRLYAERKYDQIEQARQDGRLNDLLTSESEGA